LLIERDNEELVTTIKPVKKDNIYSIGVYIKDSIIGVGTLTYYIKEANIYGSLGHKISEGNFITGDIYDAKVDEIIKPTRGQAGEKKATIFGSTIGNVEINSDTGVQGITNSKFNDSKMKLLGYKVKEEVNLGNAQIWTCVNGIEVKKYDIEITKLIKQDKKEVKGIIYKIVDKDLIDISGGIVQGMSGSPIVQDDKIIGAVTHVSINDATIGYGIYIEWMFEDMGIRVK
jgi:stage IV sporulation protein B